MANSTQLVTAIKLALRQQGISYRALAKALALSESAIKQMFASGNMSLKRVDAICSVLKLDLTDLIGSINEAETKIERLSYPFEKELVDDLRLLLVAYCVVNHWPMAAIVERYKISSTECIQYLAKLDRMKLIELLPGNRIRPLTKHNFKWINNGPIEKFFRTQVQSEFLASHFSGNDSIRVVNSANLTVQARQQLIERIKMIERLFEDISQQEKKRDPLDKQGTTMVLAIRPWEFTAFVTLQR